MIQALVVYGRVITNVSRQSDRRSCELLKQLMPDERGAQKKTGRLQMSRPAEFSAKMRNKHTRITGRPARSAPDTR
jgi:hypothetical protein